MAYFNHAFKKTFLATKTPDQVASGTPGDADAKVAITDGILNTAGVGVWELKSTAAADGYQIGPGVTGFFDAKTNLSMTLASMDDDCCPFFIAAASIKLKDKQGPFHGGYQESNKSKIVNPKFLRKAWAQESNVPQRAVTEIGGTPGNIAADSTCNKEFLCEETYYLRIDVKGTAALRFANHNLYQTLGAYGGCCPDPAVPTAVDPTIIYLQWAEEIAGIAGSDAASDKGNPYMRDMIRPLITVTTATGTQTYAQNAKIAAEEALTVGSIWANIPTTGVTAAGLILVGAYEDTVFGDCTFQMTDYYGKDPLQVFASEVDLNGDPCAFAGLCVERTCLGGKANGLGESVARDVILHESYLQNFFASDLRVREITQGTDVFNLVDRTALYNRFYMLHSVPRYNNPTGVFDNDQYLLEIIGAATGFVDTLKTPINALLACNGCELTEVFEFVPCSFTLPNIVV